jgi:hypothetical protein
MAIARNRMGHVSFGGQDAAVRAMRAEVQEYLRENRGRFESALLFNVMEEGFVVTEEEMADYALGRVTAMDSWAGEEALIAYSATQELTIRVLRPDGTFNIIGEGDIEISLFYANYVHYEPMVTMTKKERTALQNCKYRKSAKAEENKEKDRHRKRNHTAETQDKEEEKKKPKKK